MILRPQTQYVTVSDADVAYQVVGDGPLDILYCYGLGSHIDMHWNEPGGVHWIRQLASFGRMIMFDRRGTGASDGVPRDAILTWEEWTEDFRSVLDAWSRRRLEGAGRRTQGATAPKPRPRQARGALEGYVQPGFVDVTPPVLSGPLRGLTNITRLAWTYCHLAGAISHAIGLDFPHCCVRNQLRISLVTATDDTFGTHRSHSRVQTRCVRPPDGLSAPTGKDGSLGSCRSIAFRHGSRTFGSDDRALMVRCVA